MCTIQSKYLLLRPAGACHLPLNTYINQHGTSYELFFLQRWGGMICKCDCLVEREEEEEEE
jgi:hypothetical protein